MEKNFDWELYFNKKLNIKTDDFFEQLKEHDKELEEKQKNIKFNDELNWGDIKLEIIGVSGGDKYDNSTT